MYNYYHMKEMPLKTYTNESDKQFTKIRNLVTDKDKVYILVKAYIYVKVKIPIQLT